MPHDDLAALEKGVVVAELESEAVVRAYLWVEEDLVLEGIQRIDDDRQRVVVDHDQLGRIGPGAGVSATIATIASPT